MQRHVSRLALSMGAALGCAVLAACNDEEVTNFVTATPFTQTNLVSDVAGGAPTVDPLLVNPWGIGFNSEGALWVANNGSGTATVYDAAGAKVNTVVNIPRSGGANGGAPTGLTFNTTPDFAIPGFGTATIIFAGEDGTISAWNMSSVDAKIVVDRSGSGAVYKGVAIAQNGNANALYATDFRNAQIDVFDANFNFVTSFTDSSIPEGYAPFGIQNIGGKLYVTYAKQLLPDKMDDEPGFGNGFVDVFNADGTLDHRFASNGTLNAPWGVALAPANFGSFGGAILVGNFGDGQIGAYDVNGAFLGLLRDANTNSPIVIPGLWGLTFGPAAGSTTLYFSSGPADETHGLVGTLTPK